MNVKYSWELTTFCLQDFRSALRHLIFGSTSGGFSDEPATQPGGGAAMVASATVSAAPRMMSRGTVNGVFASRLSVSSKEETSPNRRVGDLILSFIPLTYR